MGIDVCMCVCVCVFVSACACAPVLLPLEDLVGPRGQLHVVLELLDHLLAGRDLVHDLPVPLLELLELFLVLHVLVLEKVDLLLENLGTSRASEGVSGGISERERQGGRDRE